MATIRIQGVPLKEHKHIWIALTDIFGIGRSRSSAICKSLGIDSSRKVVDLTEAELHAVSDECGKYRLEGELRREVQAAIRRLREIGSYRGFRHRKGLPLRGQRTRTNARTRKGPRGKQVSKKK
jgi:small subunit ribosomal protein S13